MHKNTGFNGLFTKRGLVEFCIKYKIQIIFILFLTAHIFLRFYLLFQRADLGFDQIESAWTAKSIIVDKHFLINGPVIKGNSGIYMGPLYYYLITIIYFFTNLDPIASPIFQGIMSVLNLLVLYYVTKKLFGTNVALIAIFINLFSIIVMNADRVQSAYYLIVPMSYLIFYALYKVVCGEAKYILLLGLFMGLAFHIDFTSILYPIFIFLALPFFPRDKETLKYLFLSLLIFIVFLLPSLLSQLTIQHSTPVKFLYLLHNYYHGFHLTRILQLLHDAFISYEQILQFRFLRPLVFLVLPIFSLLYYTTNPKKQSLKLFYLMTLWIIIPWLVLSTYSGELTDYYFSLPRDIAIATLAYITFFLYQRKLFIYKLIPIVFFGIYALYSLQLFFNSNNGNLLKTEANVRKSISKKKVIFFKPSDLESYIYYVYTRQ